MKLLRVIGLVLLSCFLNMSWAFCETVASGISSADLALLNTPVGTDWTSMILNTLLSVLTLALTTIIPMGVRFLMKKLKIQKTDEQNVLLDLIKTAASIGVRWASQSMRGGNRGSEKKKKVEDFIKNHIRDFVESRTKLKIDTQVMDDLIEKSIESAVNELADSRKYLGNEDEVPIA